MSFPQSITSDPLFLIFKKLDFKDLCVLYRTSSELQKAIESYYLLKLNVSLQKIAAIKIQRWWRNLIITKKCNCKMRKYCATCNNYDPLCYYHCSDDGCRNHILIEFPSPLCRFLPKNSGSHIQKCKKGVHSHYVFYHPGIDEDVFSCRPLKRWQRNFIWTGCAKKEHTIVFGFYSCDPRISIKDIIKHPQKEEKIKRKWLSDDDNVQLVGRWMDLPHDPDRWKRNSH